MSAPWYRLVVGDPAVESDPFAAIRRAFSERYPPGSSARLITQLESDGGVHCVAVAYVSAEAAELAHAWGGRCVPAPPPVSKSGSGR